MLNNFVNYFQLLGGWVDSMEACLGKTGIIIESTSKNKIWKVKMDDSGGEYLWGEELLEIITGVPQQEVVDDIDFDRPVDCIYHPEAYEWHLAKIVSDINDEGLFRVQYDDRDSAIALGLPELVGKERMCNYKRIFIVCPSDKSASSINIRKGSMLREDDSDIVGQIPRGTSIEVVGDAKRVTFKGISYLRLQLANGTGWTTLKMFDASGYTGLKFVRYSSLEELPNLVMSAISFESPPIVTSRLIKNFPSNLLDLINGKSVVHHAIEKQCSRDLIEELVCGIDRDLYNRKLETDDLGRTPLHVAILSSSSYDVVVYLLENFPLSCWKKDSIGRLPIHYAIDVNADMETLKALTKCNSETLSEPDNKNQTPLHIAVAGKGSLAATNLLLQTAPISLKIKDYQQMLVLHHALQNDAIDEETIVAFLENFPESAKDMDGHGRLPLHYMCMRASATMSLFERLVDMNKTAMTRKDQSNRLPLHYAVCNKLAEPIIKHLLAVRIIKHDRWRIESFYPCTADSNALSAPSACTDPSYTCHQGHVMTKLTGCPPGYTGNCFCDSCRKTNIHTTEYLHHCASCKYDLCSTCAPAGIQGGAEVGSQWRSDQMFKVKLPIANIDESSTAKTYVAFDACSNPAPGHYVTFFRDESRTSFWGQLRYMSKNNLPGIQNNPSLEIPTNEFFVMFGTLKFSPGDVVELCEDYVMYTDATGGLLSLVFFILNH
jgi:ankyrin repeat protein